MLATMFYIVQIYLHRFVFTRLAIFGCFLPGLPGCSYPAILSRVTESRVDFGKIVGSRVNCSRVDFGSRVTGAG